MHANLRPPVVRLPPRSSFEILLARSAQIAIIFVALVVLVMALQHGRFLLAPLALSVVIGLMLGPLATYLEDRRRFPCWLSALVVVLVFLLIVAALALAIAQPLGFWFGRAPQIWEQLQVRLGELREPIAALQSFRDELREVAGGSNMTVALEETSPAESIAMMAPAIGAQILIFLAGLYFFIATRYQTRAAILRLCLSRRLRWRTAHIFRDVERDVSTYLLSIAAINTGLGVAVALAMWSIGVPSPALWGALAGLLNFVIYIGPALMAVVLFAVGLTTFDTLATSLAPPLVYLALNMVEAQFVTPMAIGRTLTLNPFVIFLALAFWLWIWGPLGGFIAIPALLIVHSAASNILPGMDWSRRPHGTDRARR
ncbi:MAG: AI-2E family transporter [Rhizobiaceae bacterium]|nr:AI-2E family transporter [Rhizobiaceae bacterium]MCV0409027.1 AI-2E family transporter [Rhizobiaceae bacterium]